MKVPAEFEEGGLMSPTDPLRASLPEDVFFSEDTEFLVVQCQRCGWEAVFSTGGAQLDEIRRTVAAHECSRSEEVPNG
jgi:hypothetical protein